MFLFCICFRLPPHLGGNELVLLLDGALADLQGACHDFHVAQLPTLFIAHRDEAPRSADLRQHLRGDPVLELPCLRQLASEDEGAETRLVY